MSDDFGPHDMPWNSVVLDKQEHQRDVRGRKKRQVLVLGELAHMTRVELTQRGAELTLAGDASAALTLLAERDFDVVVVDLSTFAGGLRLVGALKSGADAFLRSELKGRGWETARRMDALLEEELARLKETPEVSVEDELRDLPLPFEEAGKPAQQIFDVARVEAARARHAFTPFVVAPPDPGESYAVIVMPPAAAYMKDPAKLPLATAIMTVDSAALLGAAKPMA